ncbi:phage baseplate assembly protein V [Desulfocastanea catecholica]
MATDRLSRLENAVYQRVYGKYAGKVIDNNDSAGLGRLLVSVPAVLLTEQKWAMPCVPYAGPNVGSYFLPPVDAGVWVEFEGGDVSRPIWVGCFWGDGQLPTQATDPDQRVLVTETSELSIDDSAGKVLIKNNQNVSTTWDADVATQAGDTATHTVAASGIVSENSPGKVEVGSSGVKINDGAFSVM